MTIPELFQKIREAPGMYLSHPSARSLRSFLIGYEMGLHGTDTEFLAFSGDFGNWIRNRFNIHSSQHRTKIIEFYSTTENEEMALFWKLYDEFESKPKRKRKGAASDRPEAVKP